jgi:hypothetical protein
MEATFKNEKFRKEKLELFVFVVVFVVFETDKFEISEFKYEAGKNLKIRRGRASTNQIRSSSMKIEFGFYLLF